MTPVVELRRQIDELTARLNATECRHCGHPYEDHWPLDRCWWPRTRHKHTCRCKGFADPALTLECYQPLAEAPPAKDAQ